MRGRIVECVRARVRVCVCACVRALFWRDSQGPAESSRSVQKDAGDEVPHWFHCSPNEAHGFHLENDVRVFLRSRQTASAIVDSLIWALLSESRSHVVVVAFRSLCHSVHSSVHHDRHIVNE